MVTSFWGHFIICICSVYIIKYLHVPDLLFLSEVSVNSDKLADFGHERSASLPGFTEISFAIIEETVKGKRAFVARKSVIQNYTMPSRKNQSKAAIIAAL